MLLVKRLEVLQIQDKAPNATENWCWDLMGWDHTRVGQNSMRRAGGKMEPLLRLSASVQLLRPELRRCAARTFLSN